MLGIHAVPTFRREDCRDYVEDRGTECWLVTGTFCRGEEQPNLEIKILKCRECDSYRYAVFGQQEKRTRVR